MKIVKISELDGVSRYGTCNKCGASSQNDKDMIRISPENGSSICLCKECALELLKDLTDSSQEFPYLYRDATEKVLFMYKSIQNKVCLLN